MDRRTEAAFRAAQRAQDELQDLQRIAAGDAKPSKSKARTLARACDETFKAWMAACKESTQH